MSYKSLATIATMLSWLVLAFSGDPNLFRVSAILLMVLAIRFEIRALSEENEG